jgi:NAD(P) transhydrogenase
MPGERRVDEVDMVVIGSGPAGEKGAAQAAYFGKSVVIVERSANPGGAAVSNAGIPTKTLRQTALYVTGFRERDVYGVRIHLEPEVIFSTLRARTREVIESMTRSVRENIDRHAIELIRGEATLGEDRTVHVRTEDGERKLRADVILIATGSRPFHPAGIPFDDPDVLDSEAMLGIDAPVASIVVVGGGAVGCEYASIFTALGADVSLIDLGPRLLPFLDGEMSDLLAQSFRDLGMQVLLQSGTASVTRDEDGLTVRLPSGRELRPEKVLYAAGRSGNVEELGLGAVGVDVDARNRVLVNDRFETSVAGVYAAGDVIGPPALASVSMEQARVAVCHAFDLHFKETVDYLAPFGVYSIPEVAMVGLTEEAASAQGIDYEVGRFPLEKNSKARIAGTTTGLIKLIFKRRDHSLLGVHVLGDSAAELIHQGQAVLHHGGSIDFFINATFNVPTLSDAYKYAAYDGLQRLSHAG